MLIARISIVIFLKDIMKLSKMSVLCYIFKENSVGCI